MDDQISPNSCGVESPVDYGLNGDNLDSANRDTESIHWFNVLCYDNRVSNWNLDDNQPIRPILDLPNAKLRADYIVLALRIIVKNCEYLKNFSKIVPAHIPHQYSKEMRKQSQVVSLYTRELSKQQRWLNKCDSF